MLKMRYWTDREHFVGTNGMSPSPSCSGPESLEFQRIEFGVTEVMVHRATSPPAPGCSVSSTLNPRAPEFILSCTNSRTSPGDGDRDTNFSPVDRRDPIPDAALDGACPGEDEGGLDPREQKKKRPPGYYSYLKDGAEGAALPEALVNGHTGHASPTTPDGLGPDVAESAADLTPLPAPRTCNSPQDSADLGSNAQGSGGSLPGALEGRTARQPEACPRITLEPSCPSSEVEASGPTGAQTAESLALANGRILESPSMGLAANGLDPHPVGAMDSEPAGASSAIDMLSPVAGSVPGGPPKSWASLFHSAKPPSTALPGASVDTPCSLPATPSVVSEKPVEVKEGLVPVSEDPVALEMAGQFWGQRS